jgi:hypothetical protein
MDGNLTFLGLQLEWSPQKTENVTIRDKRVRTAVDQAPPPA